jgi:hypothetical protein
MRGSKSALQYKCPNNGWCDSTVASILANMEYLGVAVTNRGKLKSYKDHTRIELPVDEWTVFPGAHPAIIDQDTYDTVQRIRDGRKRPTKLGDMGALNGRLFCWDCGSKMHIKRHSKGRNSVYVYYVCGRSSSYSDCYRECRPHTIRKDVVEQLVLTDIRRVFTFAKDSEGRFIETVSKQSRKDIEKNIRKAKTEYTKSENRIRQLNDIIAQIFENKVSGEISSERFAIMLSKYEQEQAELTSRLDELQPVIDQATEQAQNTDKFLRLVKSYTEIDTLTAEIANEFVERVEIGEAEVVQSRGYNHWKEEKRQDIKIVYNYIGTIPDGN